MTELPPLAYDIDGAAKALKCGKSTIYTLIRDGSLRAFRIGRKRGLRVSVEEAQRWLREHEGSQTATSPAIARSDGAKGGQLPTTVTRALANAKG